MAQVCAYQDSIEELGARLVFVGNGLPAMAESFRTEYCPGAEVLVDPEREAFRAFGLRWGRLVSLHPGATVAAARVMKAGFRQGKTQGDPWQQGGAFVIAPGGRIHYAHVSKHPGDHADPEACLEGLRALRGGDEASGHAEGAST